MKSRLLSLVFIFSTFLLLVSCSNSQQIELYDYKNIIIDEEYTELTNEEVEAIILLDFSSSEFYQLIPDKKTIGDQDIVLIDILSENENFQMKNYYYNIGDEVISEALDEILIGKCVEEQFNYNMTIDNINEDVTIVIKGIYELPDAKDEDALMNFYSFKSVDAVYEFIRHRAKEEIVFNYMWEKILNNSEIKEFPNYIKEKIKNSESSYKYSTDSESASIEEINQNIYNFYYELTIADAILAKEGITIEEKDMTDKRLELSEQNNISVEELSMYLFEDDIYYAVAMDELKSILLSYAILD